MENSTHGPNKSCEEARNWGAPVEGVPTSMCLQRAFVAHGISSYFETDDNRYASFYESPVTLGYDCYSPLQWTLLSFALINNQNVSLTLWDLDESFPSFDENLLFWNLTKTALHRVDTQDGVDEWEVTAYEYDGRGLTTKQTDALGNVTEYEYNGNGSGLQGGRRRDGNRIFL